MQSQTLPSKEASQFRQLVNFYENKQNKKALKLADGILKKFPDHGETLAMKGLILSYMSQKAEGLELARLGLSKNVRSSTCWHVFGLLHRSDLNYTEAAKAFMNASRLDANNLNILRDLCNLQIHIRDYPALLKTRQTLLKLKANHKNHWIGFAIANHMLKNYSMAIKAVEGYTATLEEGSLTTIERTELELYKNMILQESGDYQAAYTHLVENTDKINDRLAYREIMGDLLLKLGRSEEAERYFKELIVMNNENTKYLQAYQQAKGLPTAYDNIDQSAEQQLSALYDELKAEFPKSALLSQIPLQFTSGDNFRTRFTAYVQPYIQKGIPSLFSSVNNLYKNQQKVAIIEEVMTNYHKSIAESADAGDSIVWAEAFLARHHDRLANFNKALEYIDKAIERSPSMVDLYLFKARILKHSGDAKQASDLVEKARSMDLADRYLNTKSTKYKIRAGLIKEAEETIGVYYKEKEADVNASLSELQCMWYEIETGKAYQYLLNKPGLALKRFLQVDSHFSVFHEDQFDFHSYCIRKMTLRSYVEMLRMEDRLYGQKYFVQAATEICKIYIGLHDQPYQPEHEKETNATDAAENELDEEARKARKKKDKEEAKRRKKEEEEQRKKQQEAAKKKAKGKEDKEESAKKVDEDPQGIKLLTTPTPLVEAQKFLNKLQTYAADKLETHLLSCDLYLRKKKYLLVLKHLKAAAKLVGTTNEHVSKQILSFVNTVDSVSPSLSPVVAEVLKEGKEFFLQNKNL